MSFKNFLTEAKKAARVGDVTSLLMKYGFERGPGYVDARSTKVYRLLNNVKAEVASVDVTNDQYDGLDVYVYGGPKFNDIQATDLPKLEAALKTLANKAKASAKPASDDKVWKWLSDNQEFSKKDIQDYGATYYVSGGRIYFNAGEAIRMWVPLVDGLSRDARDVAGSSPAGLADIGYTVATFPAWLDKNGFTKKKPEPRVRSYPMYD